MFDNRNRRLDLCALALLALVVFVGVALWTYDRYDPPSSLVYPPSDTVHNACGYAGAYTAHWLLESLGLGAYYLAGSLAALTVMLLARREIDQPVLRAVGWAVSLVGLTTLFALAVPNWTPGPVVGAGGNVGAMGRGMLEAHFALAGAYIFTLSVLAAGLLLATDYFLLKMAVTTTRVSGRSLKVLGQSSRFTAASKSAAHMKTDLEDDLEEDLEEADEEDLEDEEPEDREIKVRTPADKAEKCEEDEDEDEDDEDAEEEDAEGEVAAATGVAASTGSKLAGTLKSALGIKPPTPPTERKKSEREQIIDQLEAAESAGVDAEVDYELPPLDLLLPADNVCYEEHEREVRGKAKILEKTFRNFGFNIRVVEIETGPVVAQYEVELEAGLRLSRITGLADDLAIALRVPSVRIVAPVPGKNTVGIEVPNENRSLVRLREVIEETNGRAKRMKIPIYLGKDVAGNPMVVDLAALPHLLIAGRTGTGKSVCLNSIIVSLLMTRGPDEVRMLMIDPKMVELNGYRRLPHLMHPVVTDMRKAEAILAWAVDKMEERYQLLSRAGVRHVSVYNQLGDEELRERIEPDSEEEWRHTPRHLPYIVIVADELADLMMTAGKDVEQHIIRLAQKSRAVGIHLIVATQKPTVDVITGLIKSNLPARIAFQVASRVDSRVVLDEMGADKLLGNGDMLFLLPGTSTLLRGQGTYLSDDEISRVVEFVATDAPQFASELMQLKTKDELEAAGAGGFKHRDELYETAVDIVVRERRGSVSLLQRALGIGYGRAARLIDFMAEDGIVGEYNGSQAREVLISLEEWDVMTRAGDAGGENASGEAATAAGAAGSLTPRAIAGRIHAAESSTSAVAADGAACPTSERIARRSNKILPDPDEPSDLEDPTDERDDSLCDGEVCEDADEEEYEEVEEDESDVDESDDEDEDEEGEWEEDDEAAEDDEDWEEEDEEIEESETV